MSEENFCSTCGFDKHITNALKDMRNEKDFSDVTLACGNDQILAHKVILAAYSPFFRNILIQNPHPHPLIYLKCANYKDLQAILNYLYLGQVDVPLENVKSFLALAKDLEIKGMDKALNSLDETTADDSATGSKVYEKVPRPQPSTNKRPPQESSSKQKTPQPSRIEKSPHRSRPPGQMEQKVAGMRSRSPSPAPKLPPSKYIRTSATGSPPLRNEDDHLNDKDLNNQSEFTSPSGVKQGHVESKDGPKDVKDDEILNGSVDNPQVPGGQGQPAGGPGGPASLEDEFQNHVEFPSSPAGLFGDSQSPRDNRDGGSRERGNHDFFDGAGFEGQDKFFDRSGGQDGFCRGIVGRDGGFQKGSPGFGRAEIGGRGGFRGRGGHDGPFKERGSVGFGGPGIGTSEQPYQEITNTLYKDRDVADAQEKDSDVTNAQDQAPEVMNTEDIDAQNDEDLQSTIASQSESSIAGSSDVETVESYGEAKEEIERLQKFVTDNLEVHENNLVCKICLKTYQRRWNAERHIVCIYIQTIHFGEQKVCRCCGQFFKHYETLARHHRSGNCSLPNYNV